MKLEHKYFKKFFKGLFILSFLIILIVILIFCFSNNSTVWKATSVITPIVVIIGITGLSYYIKANYDREQKQQDRIKEIQILKNEIYTFQKCYVGFYHLFQNIFYKTKINEEIPDVGFFKQRLQNVIDELKKINIEVHKNPNNSNLKSKQTWKFKFDLDDSLKCIYNKCKNDLNFQKNQINNLQQRFQLTNQQDSIQAYENYLLIDVANKGVSFFLHNEFWNFLNKLLNQLNETMKSGDYEFKHQILENSIDIKLIDQFIQKLSKIYNLFSLRGYEFEDNIFNFKLDSFDPNNENCKIIMRIINRIWKILRFTSNYKVVEKYNENETKLPKKLNNPDFLNELDEIYDELNQIMKKIAPFKTLTKKWFLEHSDNNLFNGIN